MPSSVWTPNTYRWDIAESWSGVGELARGLRVGRLMAQLLHNRGLDDPATARTFLSPKLADLHDPTELPGCAAAAEHIVATARAGEKIVLYGDYDVDGMTGVAILHGVLTLLDAEVDYYIPHRIDEGYGLNISALEAIAADGAKLVVTVDCGVTAVECAALAAELGLRLIITDHHTPGDEPPRAEAVVHPNIGDVYRNPHLCGAGVALKLAWQIARVATGSERVAGPYKTFLLDATCMAALGTIADVVPLVGENRALATFGLKGLVATRHPGLRALIDAAGLTGQRVGAYDVGFRLAPRLNAAGRMGHAAEAAELLVRHDRIDCGAVARALSAANDQRRKVERAVFDEAAERVAAAGLDSLDHRVIVLAKAGWHAGVIGIVASRIVGRFHRPAVLIALDGEVGSGSARSIAGYHIANGFSACAEHLIGHGGHAMAAGLKIAADKVDDFAAALAAHARDHIDEAMLTPAVRIDAEVSLGELSLPVVRQIESMAPFGAGNPAPMVAIRGVTLSSPAKRMGRGGNTLGLLLADGRSRVRCVGFGLGAAADRMAGVRTVDVVGEPGINRYNGRESVQLVLKDIQWQ